MATGLWSGEEANRSGQLSSQSAAWPAGARASEGGSLMNGCLIPQPLSGHPGFSGRDRGSLSGMCQPPGQWAQLQVPQSLRTADAEC